MSDSARLKKFIQLKIFDDQTPYDEETIERKLEELEDGDMQRTRQKGFAGNSAYVQVFEDMINTVLDKENHLLSTEECYTLEAYRNLHYSGRYCLARLLLLKPNHWYPVNNFTKWTREVGEDGLSHGMEEICRPVKELLLRTTKQIKQEHIEEDLKPNAEEHKMDVIDLTASDDEEDKKPDIRVLEAQTPGAGPSRLVTPPLVEEGEDEDTFQRILDYNPKDADLSYLCQDDTTMTIEELLNRMTVEQLKQLTKQNKCSPGFKPKKSDYIAALLKNGRTQTTLGFSVKSSSKGNNQAPDPFRQTQLPFGPKKHTTVQTTLPFGNSSAKAKPPTHDRLRKQVLAVLGKCYRVNYDFFKLARRLHIIYFRSFEYPDKLMIPALLTRFKKLNYPKYNYERDRDIWASRHDFLEYEKALALEAHVDELLEAEAIAHAKAADLKARGETPSRASSTRAKTPRRKSTIPQTPVKQDPDAEYTPDDEDEVLDPPEESVNVKKARKFVEFLDGWLLERWKHQVTLKEHDDRPPSLQRFESGHVYTRLVRRSLPCLAALKQYEREMEVSRLLLDQKVWLRGTRAKLYERREILQSRYLCHISDNGLRKDEIRYEALQGVKEALLDDDTHLVARPSLMRRLRRLEKQLKIPPEDRAWCERELRKADVVTVRAKRIHHRASSLKLDTSGNVLNKTTPGVDSYFRKAVGDGLQMVEDEKPPEPEKQKRPSWRKKGKTVWEGRLDRQGRPEEVNVEERALQWYQDEGFRGFHAETSIMTMIWVLMNWDIVFKDVRGAFETAYQSAPSDIVDDSFYHSRKDSFEERFEEIRNGKAAEIITRHDTMYRARETRAIGVRWDICQLPDLIEIVECLGGPSLETISRLFCEDYMGRSSGGPDLIVWNHAKRICKFVEVKGPGDTPQENQKLWFDSLLGADIPVEICKVEDMNDVKAQTSTRKGRKAPSSTVRKRKLAAGKGKGKEASSANEAEVDYDQLDIRSENDDGDELPQLRASQRAAKRRKTDPGPLATS